MSYSSFSFFLSFVLYEILCESIIMTTQISYIDYIYGISGMREMPLEEANSYVRVWGLILSSHLYPFSTTFFIFLFLLEGLLSNLSLQVHVLPQEMLGRSTFGLSMWLLKWFPVRIVDRLLLLLSRFTIGDTGKIGLPRPQLGPLELKSRSGKTPVLDVGTLAQIKSGNIKV